jgi:transposase
MPALAQTASPDQIRQLEAATRQVAEKTREIGLLRDEVTALKHQLEWFKKQIFGTRSERFEDPNPQQLSLGETVPVPASVESTQAVPAHTRKIAKRASDSADALPFFDESRVPVETIVLTSVEAKGLAPDQFEVIGEKTTYKLAQRPGSTVVIKYVRPVIKIHETQTLHTAPAPAGVLDASRADVSFIAGLLIDKFAWHLPLYRQHQRLLDAGITVSRPWLTQISQQGAALLAPIYEAQLASIRDSRVKAMDETPIKAGKAGPGSMKSAFFWPIYGEQDEVCFPFFESRRAEHVVAALGLHQAPGSVLISDGYAAYEAYAKKTGVTHAQCWAHARREIFEAKAIEPDTAAEALTRIQAIYAVEEQIRTKKLTGAQKYQYRLTHSQPLVADFFGWVDQLLQRQAFLPSNPMTKALAYCHHRRVGLEVFLADPDVPPDTNHLERALRVIPMGRKSWMFCWTELGARHVGILQSLIVTCRLHGIDPYTYLVDVLQRIQIHPAKQVADLTPRLWKPLFAANPMRSDLHAL